MSWHDAETVGSVHIPYNWTYADAAARTGASGFGAGDIGKLCRQLDDDSLWMLTSTSPSWIAVGSGGVVPAHTLGGASHTADTLADLNSKISDANVDDDGDPRDPNAHASSHQNGGSDELSVAGLSGELADNQPPKTHASSHSDGGADEMSVEDLATAGTDGQVPTSNGAGGLTMEDPAGGSISKLFQGVDTAGGLTVSGTAQVIPLNYETIKDDYFTHSTSVNPGEVEINEDGWYKVSAMMTVASVDGTGGIRGNPELHIEIDSGSGWVEQPDQMGGYVREDTTIPLSTSVTGVGLFEFSDGDKIRLTVYDTAATPPNEETRANSQRLILEYIDRSGTGGSTVNNLKDVGDVDAPSPQLGSRLIFNDVTSKWEEEAMPLIPYGSLIGKDWAPTWAQLEAHGNAAFFNTSVSVSSHVGNATVATLNSLSAIVGDSYTLTDGGVLTSGSLVVTPGDLVGWSGTAWVMVASGTEAGYVDAGLRIQLSIITPLVSPYTDGTDDGKIFAFDGSDNTGEETTANLKLTLPSPATLPDDSMVRGPFYVANFSGDNRLIVEIESGGKFSDGLGGIYIDQDSESVQVGAVNGNLASTWMRISRVHHHLQVRRVATWAASNFLSWASVEFDTEDHEGNPSVSYWDNPSNKTRVYAALRGEYHISGFMAFNSTGGILSWTAHGRVLKNGTDVVPGTLLPTGNYANEDQTITLPPVIVSLEVGDYIEVQALQSSLVGSLKTVMLSMEKNY